MMGEPTLESIEDFDNNESQEKRDIVKRVVYALLFIGVLYTASKFYFSSVSDELPHVSKDAFYK